MRSGKIASVIKQEVEFLLFRAANLPLKSVGGINTLPCLFEALTGEKTADFRPENGTKSRRRRSAFLYSIQGSDAAIPKISKKESWNVLFYNT